MTKRNLSTKFEDPFSEEIWKTTYKDYKDETIDDTLYRVAKAVASAEITKDKQEEWTEKFYDMLTDFKVTAGGRIYANAGTEWKGTTLFNCYTAPRRKKDIDSLDNIILNLSNQAQTLKSEGGWGENFSYIRPRGSFIHGIGVESPGAVKYMEIFDKTSDVITSGSGIKTKNKKSKNKIRKGAMMGVIDCIAGNTPINTLQGKVPVKDLVGTKPYLYCVDDEGNVRVRQANKVWSKGVRKTIRVIFDNDDYIECTPEHEFMLTGGKFIKAKDLQTGDSLAALNKRLINDYLTLGVSGSRVTIAEHNAVYEMKYGEYPSILGKKKREGSDTVAHHTDHKKWNNNPDNIQRMTLSEHAQHHSELLKEYQQARADHMRGTTWEEFYGSEKVEQIKRKYISQAPWNKGLTGKKYKEHSPDGFGGWARNVNHKVVRIEDSIEQEVFDISMPDFHNFAANGVFIHNCWHPDVIEFVTAKQSSGRLTKFNISVNCSDEFMSKILRVKEIEQELAEEMNFDQPNDEKVQKLTAEKEEVDKWVLRFPVTNHHKYASEWNGDLREWEQKGYPTEEYRTISATWLWNLIMESTYNRAEPGVLFLDRANENNPGYYFENILETNPCGEITLPESGVCNLGAINLTRFVNRNGTDFNYDKIKKYVSYLVRFLDNINDISNFPLKQYQKTAVEKRRIGIGLLGWGSSLFMLRTRFGSEKADVLRDKVLKTIYQTAYMTSIDLAEEKGMFKYCDPEKHLNGKFVQRLGLPKTYQEKMLKVGIRNSTLGAIAPNGNTSIFANVVSGGLEPIFMPEYIRTVIVSEVPEDMVDQTPKWYEGEWRETDIFKFDKEGDEEILKGKHNGVVYKIDKNRGLTKEVLCEDYGVRWLKKKGWWDPAAEWAVTTTELTAAEHLNDLKGFAKYIDQSCSKTINVPHDYSFNDFQHIYTDAYKSGFIKGVTTYRAGTMTSVLSAADEKEADVIDEEIILDDVKLPTQGPAQFSTIKAEGKKWYLTTIMDENGGRPVAFFVHTNAHEKSVTTSDAVDHLLALARDKGIPERWIQDTEEKIKADNNATKIARCISLNLRHGVLIKNVVAALDNVKDVYVGTFLFQIKKYLMTWIKDGEKVQNGDCPECGAKDSFVFSEGCIKCDQCGYSKCG